MAFSMNELYALHSCKIAQDWIRTPALEYWMQPGLVAQGVGTFSSGVFAVGNNGWVNTGTILGVAGTGADFPLAAAHLYYSTVSSEMPADFGTPAHFAIDTAGDLLNSPAMFGDPTHMAIAAELAGTRDLPNRLIFDTWSRFAVVITTSDTSGFGFVEAGGAASVANDAMAIFYSDGTNFLLRSAAATSSALMAADTSPHRFRLVVDRINQLIYAYIDDMATAKGSIALQNDLWPVSVGAGCLASTGANFPQWGPTRVRYGWSSG